MYFSSYGPLKFALKFDENAKFSVNHTLRWNNSNLITDWETVLTLNVGKMNSESISRFQVPHLYGQLQKKLIAEHVACFKYFS